MRYHLRPVRMSIIKVYKITNAREGVETRHPTYTVSGNVSWCGQHGTQYAGSSKTKNRVAI